ncbi:3-dehydroquinate synthase [Aeoliella sp.]|uniref:3-dehydroquinate synthase n=1 Tax=Aeoliella sp. TaxID=2795800 RepID=UPI003CCB971E
MPTRTLRVDLKERGYDITIGSGTLAQCPQFLSERCGTSHVVLITDSVVDELYADAVGDLFVDAGLEVELLVIEAGEESKNAETLIDLWQTMLAEGADRGSVVAAVGGGVVGDIAGFVAATFARGVPFFQIPTTLLAQVDSSVGGKVGINLPEAKNIVGAFWQPLGVLIDVDVLSTLPANEFAAGMAEVVKYGVIMDLPFFEYLESHVEAINARDSEALQYVVERCCRLKADVVEEDEREESGRRAILNYGHTFAHAFEAATEYGQLLHGEAVAMGMVCASRLAERIGMIDAKSTERQVKLLEALSLPTQPLEFDSEEIYRLMWHDKKVAEGKLRFVLPNRLGEVILTSDVKSGDVIAVLNGQD